MRTSIISDIPGNLSALKVVLLDIEKQAVDQILCPGDLVEGGSQNDDVVEAVRELGISTVIGNHDEINDCGLKTENQD